MVTVKLASWFSRHLSQFSRYFGKTKIVPVWCLGSRSNFQDVQLGIQAGILEIRKTSRSVLVSYALS